METVIDEYGIELIKKFEKCHLTAVKSPYGDIIGYNHKGSNKTKITQKEADELLRLDWTICADFVYNKEYVPFIDLLNKNQINALISFTFDCGAISLKKLCKHNLSEIPNSMLAFIAVDGIPNEEKAKRRYIEREVFISVELNKNLENVKEIDQAMLNRLFDKKYTNEYPVPDKEFSRNKCNLEQTKWLQTALKFTGYYSGPIDGIFASETYNAVKIFQKEYTLKKPDGIMDLESINILQKIV